ncbi:MAG TPA: hypothetical protein DCS82_12675 [Rhodospirillaceae bacterium]|nr:hypothetical protein [Rhodospirillaceae bacterium]HAT36560.1 hypothetical protein [Rhodospirillaceae bacterium]
MPNAMKMMSAAATNTKTGLRQKEVEGTGLSFSKLIARDHRHLRVARVSCGESLPRGLGELLN